MVFHSPATHPRSARGDDGGLGSGAVRMLATAGSAVAQARRNHHGLGCARLLASTGSATPRRACWLAAADAPFG